jgi:FkbM family methyltransferase
MVVSRVCLLAGLVVFALVNFFFLGSMIFQTNNRKSIYIDVGGNIGDSVAAFLSVGIPLIAVPPSEFDSIYVFEPNEKFKDLYDPFRASKPVNFTLFTAAAGDFDGFAKFSGEGLGGSIDKTLTNGDLEGKKTHVIDFSRWLGETVRMEDYVICKIDSEGAEYGIVRRLIADGNICLCDRLSIEWHGWLGNKDNVHLTSYLSPSALTDDPTEACRASEEECECKIPHLNKKLPMFYCSLPRTLMWLREGCSGKTAKSKVPVLEHHEEWWPSVGLPDAMTVYSNRG